ncbi:DegT/DnrJ/EryC1/StrS family aminotransferase [Lysobacter capsici]|uniref:DegT/DnrJ/EryC1/StrS family aminotransferase n=1 Tax=Lysobacter capsici TaxID=435897 RepID=UPI001C000D83|nr:DegT/DnrJ/EryC1/StrS family aminotransferase [Lysobacter capsici]QWF17537.1 DegT/DnrJ/EryC1/StrS family aminotransferase [Lysobacter capsici]
MTTPSRELPPTAGLPLRWGDFRPGSPRTLSDSLAALIELPPDRLTLTCSGTAALVVALTALQRRGRQRRDVIVPAYTCPLVALAVAHCGLRLRLCDLRRGHFDMDADALRRLCGPNTLAIVPTHFGGRLADMAGPLRCARAVGARVIEDAAQALGARHADGSPAGTLGDIGLYSLAAGKGLSIYEGGAVIAREAMLAQRLRACAQELLPRRWRWEIRRSAELLGYGLFYGPRGLRWVYGRNVRRALARDQPAEAAQDVFPSEIPLHRVGRWRQAIGARASARLPEFLDAARKRALLRCSQMRAIEGVEILSDRTGERGTWPALLLLLSDPAARDAALAKLWGAGLGVSRLFAHALPDYDYLRGVVAPAQVPNARDFAARLLSIGNSQWLDDVAFARIVEVLQESCRDARA